MEDRKEERQSFESTLTQSHISTRNKTRKTKKNYVFFTFLYHADWHVTRKDPFFTHLFVCFDFSLRRRIPTLTIHTHFVGDAGTMHLCFFYLLCLCLSSFFSHSKILSPENICIYALIYVLMYKKICISKVSLVFFSSVIIQCSLSEYSENTLQY